MTQVFHPSWCENCSYPTTDLNEKNDILGEAKHTLTLLHIFMGSGPPPPPWSKSLGESHLCWRSSRSYSIDWQSRDPWSEARFQHSYRLANWSLIQLLLSPHTLFKEANPFFLWWRHGCFPRDGVVSSRLDCVTQSCTLPTEMYSLQRAQHALASVVTQQQRSPFAPSSSVTLLEQLRRLPADWRILFQQATATSSAYWPPTIPSYLLQNSTRSLRSFSIQLLSVTRH